MTISLSILRFSHRSCSVKKGPLKGATKLYFMHCSLVLVVIIFFSTDFYKSAFFTCSFGKTWFLSLCVLIFHFFLFLCLFFFCFVLFCFFVSPCFVFNVISKDLVAFLKGMLLRNFEHFLKKPICKKLEISETK